MDNKVIVISNIGNEIFLNDNNVRIHNEIFKKSIPENIEQVAKKYDSITDELIENYKLQLIDYVEIAKKSLEVCKSKATIIYSMGISVEILLKYILMLNKAININELGKLNHNIQGMFSNITNSDIKSQLIDDIKNIEFLIDTIKTDKGKNINIREYTVYRYNHTKNSTNLLIKNPITKKEEKNVLEVLKCVENIITAKSSNL